MKNEHVLGGLITKRAELSGQIETLQREMRELVLATVLMEGGLPGLGRGFDKAAIALFVCHLSTGPTSSKD